MYTGVSMEPLKIDVCLRESPASRILLQTPLSTTALPKIRHDDDASQIRVLVRFSFRRQSFLFVWHYQDRSEMNDFINMFEQKAPAKFLLCLQSNLSSFYSTVIRVDNSSSNVVNKLFSSVYEYSATAAPNLQNMLRILLNLLSVMRDIPIPTNCLEFPLACIP